MISEVFPEEKRRLFEIEQQLFHLEAGNTTIRISDVYLGLEDMSKRLENLDQLALQESKSRRDDYRRRIQHLKSSHAHLKSSLDNFARTKNYVHHMTADQQRLYLFGNSNKAIADVKNPDYDIEMAESESLGRSNRLVNDYLKQGQETLGELLSQRERLKGIQRKVFDIMNYLGISNTIMRTVERRDWTDKWIVYGGMLITTAILIFVIFYWP
jgi:golgi SNAP receptor complex member 2